MLSINENKGSFIVCNQPYNNKRYFVEWDKTVQSDEKHWETWKKTKLTIPSIKLYYATAKELYDAEDKKEIQGLKQLIQEDLAKGRITSTLLTYRKKGYGMVRHFYGSPDLEEELRTDLDRVPSGLLTEAHKPILENLLGTGNIEEVNEVFLWLTGAKPYFFTIPERNAHAPPINIDFNVTTSQYDSSFNIWLNSLKSGTVRQVRLSLTN